MAGRGSRFSKEGYSLPKPLIEFNGKTMIENVLENLNLDANYIFIVHQDHIEKFGIDEILKKIKPNSKIISVNEVTEGAACTALLAEKYIDDKTLMIINCDQMIHDFSFQHIIEFLEYTKSDGLLGTYLSTSPKNSFLKVDENGIVTQVEEKVVISDIALIGLHIWKNGKDFVISAKEMIKNNDTYNGEFYISKTFNYLIKKGKKILPYFFNLYHSIGTPTDLKKYLNYYEKV